MAFVYETYGPYALDRDGNKFRTEAFRKFWREISASEPKLSEAMGIYILAVRAKEKSPLKPWYVGKTDIQGFKKRFLQQASRFSDALDLAKNGEASVFLIARRNDSGKGFKKRPKEPLASNDDLETMMIASCLKQNGQLTNAMKVRHVKEITVPGYMNNAPGNMTKAAEELKRMVKAKTR